MFTLKPSFLYDVLIFPVITLMKDFYTSDWTGTVNIILWVLNVWLLRLMTTSSGLILKPSMSNLITNNLDLNQILQHNKHRVH